MQKMKRLILLTFIVFAACNGGSRKELTMESTMEIHHTALTIDSHTDTPLRMMQPGTDLGKWSDPHSGGGKVDFPRMEEGGLDGIFFAVFVGQSDRDEEGNMSARKTALQLFDSIHEVVERYPEQVELALGSGDLARIDAAGRRAVFIGIENGYVLGRDLSLIDSYYEMGARYITLCHSSNNDICDSSTDSEGPEHGGISQFGRGVLDRMNRKGIIIDVSHISDDAFYDVLECSRAPVIASHSNARSVCDHPRNLDDAMLVALAEKGGVIQLCLVNEYVANLEPNPGRDSARQALRMKYGEYGDLDDSTRALMSREWYAIDEIFPSELATVSQFVDHVDHVVELVGIDHVGFGSDFDGGAGIDGCYDVSELPNITAELLARGYSREDLDKFWGGNFLRVMREVEETAADLSHTDPRN